MFERNKLVLAAALTACAALTPIAIAQEGQEESGPGFDEVAGSILEDLKASEAELTALRERAMAEKLGPSERLRELQKELVAAEAELQRVVRLRNDGALKLSNLSKSIADRKAETQRLQGIFDDYRRNFAARVHVSELQRYQDVIDTAKSAPDDESLSQSEIFAEQVKLLDAGLTRLMEIGGGVRFEGSAVDDAGLVQQGTFAIVGPVSIFRSKDGAVVGTAELIPGTSVATIQRFSDPLDEEAAALFVETGAGQMPFDASLGNAHKIAATEETIVEHVQKGGAIIYPILIMAALALLVSLWRWSVLAFIRRPKRKDLDDLMGAIGDGDEESAKRRAHEIPGPVGEMLEVGVDNMRRSRDLMEEVMYEKVLVTKRKVNKGLPFIAVAAASAPLLGLLGTVTGIINTFKQITIFGSGDVKQLSGGISEALITTKFGLIVAIPSLLMHAYLSRKARGVISDMEANAIRLANEVAKSDAFGEGSYVAPGRVSNMMNPEHEMVRGQVAAVLTDMLGPLSNDAPGAGVTPATSPAPNPDGTVGA